MPGSDDILGALLSSSMGGGQSETDPSTLGAMKAFQGSDFLQGVPSQSGPIGQISQAVMPLIAAKIYGQQAEQSQKAEKVKTLLSVLSLVKELKGADLTDKKTQLELEKLGIERDYLKKFTDSGLHGIVNGSEIPAGSRMSMGGLSIPLGPEKMPTNELGLMERAGSDPKAAGLLQQYQDEQDRRSRLTSQLTTDRAQTLSDLSEQRRQAKTDAEIIDGRKGMYVVDKSGRRVTGATQGDVHEQGLVPLKSTDFSVLNAAKQGLGMLDQLEGLTTKVLPTKEQGLVGRAISLTGLKSTKALGTSDDIAKFNVLSKFSKMPAIQVLNNFRRIPKVEVDKLEDLSTDTDTQTSAKAKIDLVRSWLTKAVDDLGVNPEEIQSTVKSQASPTPGTKPTSSDITRQVKGMTELGYSPDKIKSVLMGLYGGDVDVDMK